MVKLKSIQNYVKNLTIVRLSIKMRIKMLKILVVDNNKDAALNLLSNLGEGEVEVSFISHVDRAINNINSNFYDVIVLGDRLEGGGDTYDVGLALKKSKNRHAAFVCIGSNIGRSNKLAALLKPYSYVVSMNDPSEVAKYTELIRQRIGQVSKKKSTKVRK